MSQNCPKGSADPFRTWVMRGAIIKELTDGSVSFDESET